MKKGSTQSEITLTNCVGFFIFSLILSYFPSQMVLFNLTVPLPPKTLQLGIFMGGVLTMGFVLTVLRCKKLTGVASIVGVAGFLIQTISLLGIAYEDIEIPSDFLAVVIFLFVFCMLLLLHINNASEPVEK